MNRAETIFLQAREQPGATERQSYLAQACGDDASLRAQVEVMLRDAEAAQDFFGAVDAESATRIEPFESEQPGTRIGRYKLIEKIGEGGMGVVYLAEQEEPVRRQVALKIIKAGMDTRRSEERRVGKECRL